MPHIPNPDDPAELSAVEARRRIGEGTLSPVALVEACIERRQRIDPAVNAMVTTLDDRARREAFAAEAAVARGDTLGALHGLPVAIKDIQATAGVRTTYGSADFTDNVPDHDAGIVARIRAAGGIVIGKTNVPERSIGANTVNRLFGATGNPYDVDLTCGGSSGGSAVAVATNMTPLATGSDHGGSLRIPACYCGVVGFRATPGVVPNEERTTPQTNYSVQGPMARDVADMALLLSVIAGRSATASRDPMAYPLDATRFASAEPIDAGDLRIGLTADLGGVLVSDAVRDAFERRADLIKAHAARADHVTVDLTDAPDVDWHLRQDVFVTQYFEEAGGWDEGFNPNVRATYESALATPMRDIAMARRRQMMLYQRFAALFDDYDVIVCPGVSVAPFPWRQLNPEQIDGKPVTNYMAWLALTSSLTVIGHPVVALPAGRDAGGLPFGLQIVGRAHRDRELLGAALGIEALLATTPAFCRPQPDTGYLTTVTSSCRTAGKDVR